MIVKHLLYLPIFYEPPIAYHKMHFFLKLTTKATAVPKTPKGNQGMCNHFSPSISNKTTGIVPKIKNKKMYLLVHFITPFYRKYASCIHNILLEEVIYKKLIIKQVINFSPYFFC